MRYLFWVVLLVIVILAGGFWYFSVPDQRVESQKLQSEINRASAELKGFAARKQDIKTQSHVDAAKKYATELLAQDAAVKSLLRDKKTTMDPKFEKAPTDPLRFDEWLIGVRKEILDQAEKAGMLLPGNFDRVWLDAGQITSTKDDRAKRIKKIALAGEVVGLLCSVKANVPVVEFAAQADQSETKKMIQVGVSALDGLELLSYKDRDGRVKDYMTHALSSSAKAPPALKKLPPMPYRASLLDVRFTAPLQVVPSVVQAIETGPRWFGVVTKLDCQRATEPYCKTPVPADAKPVKLGADGKPTFLNTHYQEAPVQVQIWVELFDFDEKQLK